MHKKAVFFKTLQICGVVIAILAICLFFLSFNVKRDIQETIGFTSIGLFPCGILIIVIGIVLQKKRNKFCTLSIVFIAISVVLLVFAAMLMPFAMLAALVSGSLLPLYVSFAGFLSGSIFLLAGLLFLRKTIK